MKITVDPGTGCAMPGCERRYRGDRHDFTSQGWSLVPADALALCRTHTLDHYRQVVGPRAELGRANAGSGNDAA